MEIVLIDHSNISAFAPLMLNWSADQIRYGLPLPAFGLVEENGSVAVGAAAGYITEDNFLISSFYVADEYRRRGGGRMILDAIKKAASGHAENLAVSYMETKEEHHALSLFLEAEGFQEYTKGALSFRFTVEDACRSRHLKEVTGHFGTLMKDMSGLALDLARKKAEQSVLAESMRSLHLDEDITVIHENDKVIDAFVAFEYCEGKGLTLAGAYNESKNPRGLVFMLQLAMAEIRKKYPPETYIYVDAVRESAVKLVRAMIENAVPVSRTYYLPLGGSQ